MRLSPRLRLAAVALVAAVSLTACSGQSPLTALKPYAASDGLQVTSGPVRGLNLLLMTRGLGRPAVLTGTFDNTGESDARVEVAIGSASIQVTIPAGQSVRLGLASGDRTLVVPAAPAAPGFLATVDVTTNGTTTSGPVPVLDGTLPAYAPVIAALDAYTDSGA